MAEDWKEIARKRREEEEAKKNSTSSEENWKEIARKTRFEQELRKVDADYINTFADSANRFFSSAEENYGKMDWGNASSTYQAVQTSMDNLEYRRNVIQNWLESHKDSLDEDSYRDLYGSLESFKTNASGIVDTFSNLRNYYSQWETQKDYDDYVVYQEDYEAKKNFNLQEGQREIEELERRRSELARNHRQPANTYLTGDASLMDSYYAAGQQSFEYDKEIAELNSLISRKKQYLNQAKHIQEGIALSGVAENADFGRYHGYQSTMKGNPAWWENGVGDTQYEWINNQNGFRDEYERSSADLHRKAAAVNPELGAAEESEYRQKGYDRLTEDEIAIYNYHYAKDGKEKAQEYLDSLRETLNYRKATEMFSGMEDNTALEMLFGVEAGLDQFKSGISSLLNTEDDYIAQSAFQIASGMVREDLADAGAKLPDWMGGASLGQLGYDAITTTANMAPSILTSMAVGMLNPVAGQWVGSAMMGASAAGNAYQEALNQGFDKDQARGYGLLVGASEIVMEKVLGGISAVGGNALGKVFTRNLSNADKAFKMVAKNLGASMLSEFSEEYLQEVLTPMFQNIALGTKNEVKIFSAEALYSGILGALTAGVMEGPSAIAGEVKTYQTGRQLLKAGVSPERLAEIGDTFAADTVAHQIAGKVNKNTGAYTMGRLFNEIGATMTEQNIGDITEALVAKNMDRETARANAEAMATVVEGGNLTDLQAAVIEANEDLAEAVRTTIIDSNSTWYQRNQGHNEVLMALAQEKAAHKASRTNPAEADGENVGSFDTVDTQNKNGSESLPETDINPAKVRSIVSNEKGKATVRLEDGSKVNVRDANVDPDEGVRIETIAKIEGISSEDASFILNTLRENPGVSAQMDGHAAKEAYKYGYYGFSREHLAKHGVFADSLTKSQRDAIYETGRKARAKNVEAKQATASQKSAVGGKSATTGKVHFDGDRTALTERQSASLAAMEKVAEALGVQIYVFESNVNERGKRIGANGWYAPKDSSVHIDLYAGANGEGTMLFTLAHELTHHIRKWSPAKFKVLADFLMQEYGNKGVNVDGLVREQMAKAKRSGRTISYDAAYEEVVADSMETMLSDGKVMEKLAKLKAQDKSLWNKIKDFISELAAKIRAVYDGMAPDSVEGRYVAEMKDSIERLQELFTEALVDASEDYQSNMAPGAEVAKVTSPVKSATVAETATVSKKESVTPETIRTPPAREAPKSKPTAPVQKQKRKLWDFGKKQKQAQETAKESLNPSWLDDELIANSRPSTWTVERAVQVFHRIKELEAKVPGLNGEANRDANDALSSSPESKRLHYMLDMIPDDIRNSAWDIYTREIVDAWKAEYAKKHQAGLTPGEEGIVANGNGDPVAYSNEDGSVLLSMRTYEEDGRKVFRDYLNKCVFSNKLTKAEMNEMLDGIEDIYSVCKEFKDKYAPFSSWSDAAVVRDTYGRPVFSVVTPNGDYKMNLDFSLVCKKRRTLDAVFNEMSRRGIIDDFELGQKSVVKINEIIRKHGLETACALCFVDAKRFRQASMADSFTNLYNELVLSLVPEDQKGSIDHFNFSGYETIKKVEGGIDTWPASKLDFTHLDEVMKNYGKGTVEHKAAKYIKSHVEGRKLLLRGDFMSSQGFDAVKTQNKDILKLYNSKKGTGGPKAAFGDVQYMNEIIKKARTWTPAKAYAVGGVRIQSFSDYVPRMVFDYVQMVYDLAATKLPAHAYSKEALFVKQFGLTGIKINMSLIPAIAEGGIAPGLDANGDYVWAGESFDFETAKQIQNAEGYTENCGTICVGVSQKHIEKLLDDPDIRMVIPYHKSGLNPIVAHMNKIAEFEDYTDNQRTKGKDGKAIAQDFDFSKALHGMGDEADPKAVADQYLKWCVANEYRPKFHMFAHLDNYYKLLEDFTLYDKDGNYVPQREVRAVFPKEGTAFGSMKDLIQEGLEEDAVVEGKRDKNLSAIVDEIQRTLPKSEAEIAETQVEQADRDLEAVKYSDRDYGGIREVLAKKGLDELSRRYGSRFPLSASFDATMRADNTDLVMETVRANSVHGKGSPFVVGRKAFISTYGTKTSVHIKQMGIDADLYADVANESISKAIGHTNVQSTLDVIPHIREVLENSILMGVERIVHTDGKGTALYGYRLYNLYWYDNGKTKTPHALVCTVVQDLNKAEGYVFQNIENVTIDRGLPGTTAGMSSSVNDDTYTVAQLYGAVKRIGRIDGGLKYTAEDRDKYLFSYTERNDGVKYSDRDSESVSNRSLLANAFEGVAQNDIEKQKIQEYKGKIDTINAEEQKLSDLKRQIRELSFAKGPRDKEKISRLRDEAAKTANRISIYDKQLLRLEGSKPLQAVLEREKKSAYRRAERKGKEALAAYQETAERQQREIRERYQESRKKAVAKAREIAEKRETKLREQWQESRQREMEDREKTAMRVKVQNVVKELNDLLLNESKKRHVPDSLKKAVAEALALVNMDTVGAEERAAYYANLIAKEQAKANPDQAKIDAYTVTMENILRQGDKMGQRLKELRDAYDEIAESNDPDIANAYDPVIAGCLKELSQSIGNTSLRNMTIEQLSDVYDMYRMVLTRVRDANKTFLNNRKEAISDLASKVVGEVRSVGGDHKYRAAVLDSVKKFGWNNLKPVYAFEHIGSGTLTDVFAEVRTGEDVWARDVTEAREYYLDKSRKYGYDKWDFKKKYRFESNSGLEFELSLEQILSIYAYSKREQAHDHLRLGGFVFDSNIETYKDGKLIKYKVNTADAHQITPDILADIISTLTKEQRGFVDEMQSYLSTTMGAKGNEVTMKMYGVKLFKEKFYFPLKSAKQFMFEQNEVSGEVRIKNSGFTNKVVAKANNPVILSNFMEVWSSHVNDMSMYHAFVLPLEDFNRVFNYNSPKSENQPSVSVKGTIQNAYGPAAVSYVKNLITDLNGGARTDSTTGIINKMLGLFKKGSVFASLSVVIQQPSAIARAAALVDTKYFIGPRVDPKRHKVLWDEVKQYAPVAIIKEMGYFDTNMGKSTQDFILGKEYSGFSEKMKALVTDSGYRDEVLSKAPALADELAWCSIWEAVKRETRAKNPGMDVKSEAFLKKAGQRFTEVITKTQVYDSVLARSANMRSKDTGMKMATAFMAEPTTSINMIADALLQGKRGNRKYCRAAIGAVIASQIFNSILVSFVYAGRDDDEDKTYAEKYVESLTGKVLDSLNPFTYIPFIKDIVSIVQGYDVERSDMAVISDLWNAWKKLGSDNVSNYRKVEDFAGSIAQIFGLPVKNIMRDVRGIWQTYKSFTSGQETTKAGIGYAVKSALPAWLGGGDVSNQQQLYEAYLSGDQTQIARVESRYEDQSAINTAVRSAIKEHYLEGKIDYGTAIEHLVQYGGLDEDDAFWKAEEWKYEGESDEDFAKYDEFFEAVQTGKNLKTVIKKYTDNGVKESTLKSKISEHFKPLYMEMSTSERASIKGYLLNSMTILGDDREDAEKKISEWEFEGKYGFAWSDRDDAYKNGEISAYELKTILMDVGGKTEEEAEIQIKVYDWQNEGFDIDSSQISVVEDYDTWCEPAGIDKDTYFDTYLFYKDSGEEGVSYSKTKECVVYINSLPLTPAQKTALALCWWSEKTVNKYKLW